MVLSMWTIEGKQEYVDLGVNKSTGEPMGFWELHPIARKKDGTAIRAKGPWMRGFDLFQYEDSEVAFEFVATRYAGEYRNLTDTYNVPLELPNTVGLTKAREIAQNMREALLLMPPWLRRHEGRPPVAVIFDWAFWNLRHPGSEVRGDAP